MVFSSLNISVSNEGNQEGLLFHLIYISTEFKDKDSLISVYQTFFPFTHLSLLYLAWFPRSPIFMPQLWVGKALKRFDVASHSMRDSPNLEYSPSPCQEHPHI